MFKLSQAPSASKRLACFKGGWTGLSEPCGLLFGKVWRYEVTNSIDADLVIWQSSEIPSLSEGAGHLPTYNTLFGASNINTALRQGFVFACVSQPQEEQRLERRSSRRSDAAPLGSCFQGRAGGFCCHIHRCISKLAFVIL